MTGKMEPDRIFKAWSNNRGIVLQHHKETEIYNYEEVDFRGAKEEVVEQKIRLHPRRIIQA